MREIRFRGRSTTSSRFVYGDLIQNKDGCVINCDFGHDFAVESRTIGQYTGLKDRNGVKIYEGDILEMTNVGWKYTLVKFHLGIFAFYTEETSFLYPMVRCYWEEGRVIGNIHENPELLKEKQ